MSTERWRDSYDRWKTTKWEPPPKASHTTEPCPIG
jgi:hypothetical protein